jgi:cupin 2 domain-containing protein
MIMIENIFDQIPFTLPEELNNVLHKSKNIRIERIVSQGHTSPEKGWFDQDENEWIILIDGYAGITFEDSHEILLNKGDYLFIPAHKKHRVTFTTKKRKTIWLTIFFK